MSQRAARSSPGHDVRPFVKAKQKKKDNEQDTRPLGARTRHIPHLQQTQRPRVTDGLRVLTERCMWVQEQEPVFGL